MDKPRIIRIRVARIELGTECDGCIGEGNLLCDELPKCMDDSAEYIFKYKEPTIEFEESIYG